VTKALSGKTSYLVAGEQCGESKMKMAKEKNIKVVDEDGPRRPHTRTTAARLTQVDGTRAGLFELIRTRKAPKGSKKQPTPKKETAAAGTRRCRVSAARGVDG
jgi:hypothetical protein